MSLKEKVLLLLKKREGEFLSGQEVALQLEVTRAGVWKAIKALQEEGYPIEAVTNRGYALQSMPDILSAVGIEQELSEDSKQLYIQVEKVLDSTNTRLKQMVTEGETRDMVLLAEEQTGGRGRFGRVFFSPQGTGLYMSFLLHPQLHYSEGELLTTAAAVAVAKALEKISGEEAQIKWVNDIWVGGRKVSGILTEASTSLESGQLEYAIIGIGINVKEPVDGFPEELKDIARSVFPNTIKKENLRNQLAGEIINQFMAYYKEIRKKEFFKEYKERSFVIGKEISVLRAGTKRKARALAIDDHCHLKVQYEDGAIEDLSSGEISIRL